ncbi:MAG: hypothetical protein HKN60_04635, partial [Rhizobiales bacterium]|nr:hypothetical protein [Hyphomicrobiales bacterium]
IPLSHTLFGTQAALAAIVVLVAARLTHAVLLPVLVLVARPQRPARALAQLLRATVFDPIVLAVPVALAVDALDFNLPETLAIVLDFLTVAAVPTALFAVAIDLAGRRIVQLGWEVPVVTAVKLLVGPFITYCVLLAIGDFEAVWIMAAMLASAMPTAVRTEVIARGAGVYTTGTADCIALSGKVGVATIALLVWLLDTGAFPLNAAELFGG